MKMNLPKEKLRINNILSKKEQIKLLNFCIENEIPIFKRTFNLKSDKEFKYYIWDGEELNRGTNEIDGYKNVSLSEFKEIMSIQKEKTFSITESEINNLKKDIKNGYHVDAINYLEKLFPKNVEDEVKLEVGKWYNYNGSIVNYQGIENDILQGYGIRSSDKEWMNLSTMGSSPKKWTEATEQEVFEALKGHALRIGVKEGVVVDRYFDSDLGLAIIDKTEYPHDDEWYLDSEKNFLEHHGFVVYFKGQWAEVYQKQNNN